MQEMILRGANRVLPLPSYYKGMKAKYYEQGEKRGFKGYRSPWIPVTGNNCHLLREGDLVIDCDGLEAPYLIGRGAVRVDEGRVEFFLEVGARNPAYISLVWINPQSANDRAWEFLKDNPMKETYLRYSESVRAALSAFADRETPPVEDVTFPLFHETDYQNALNILENGLDYYRIARRASPDIGNGFFSTCQSIKEAKGSGNFHGAIVKFLLARGTKPQWLGRNYSLWGIHGIETGGPYTWKTAVAELSASAFSSGKCVHIFDSFEKYKPVEIITDY